MDEQQARQLLGLDEGSISLRELREARNNALQAHHPDKVGSDEAALRRATYWSSQIIAAYDLLEIRILGSDADAPSVADDPAPERQSFSAAASRAAERAAARERLAAEQAAAEERALEQERAAAQARAEAQQRAAEEQRVAKERAAAQARVAAQEEADARAARHTSASESKPTRIESELDEEIPLGASRSRSISSQWGFPALLVGVAAVVGVMYLVMVGASPGARPTQTAVGAQSPVPTSTRSSPTPTTPLREAHSFFDGAKLMYQTDIVPCYSSNVGCYISGSVEYTDGSKFVPENEMPRLASLFRDNTSLDFSGQSMCREERGALYRLYVSMAVGTELIKSLKPGEMPPTSWTPTSSTLWEDCSPSTAERYRLADELKSTILPRLKATLLVAQKQVRQKNWAAARETSVTLAEIAANVAQRSVRDYPPSGPNLTWQSMAQIAWDAERVSANIGVPRLAQADSTAKLIDSVVTALDGIDTTKILW